MTVGHLTIVAPTEPGRYLLVREDSGDYSWVDISDIVDDDGDDVEDEEEPEDDFEETPGFDERVGAFVFDCIIDAFALLERFGLGSIRRLLR